ncbi:MAG TPA: ABC transporter permease subunit [Gammaproteobacteria bacterium]|nr:ABC transporter permease subunit [Gammaproteobacteria bacterium]HRA43004.1 ABC transporter permease subunit [Gammaproteobacteria bacterium]
MINKAYYQSPKTGGGLKPNLWDIIAFIIILGVLGALAYAANQMQLPYNVGEIEISLSPTKLPEYAVNTVLRMFIALFFSLLFTFIVAPLAAKNKQAEKLLLPLLDILQSVPILGMLSITIVLFIQLFPNSYLGPECAAIFAIFTSQVWNMTLSFYQSLRTVPKEYIETANMFHLSPWQRFWKIEVPYAIPGLLWNTMVSISAGWFFVVASEAISVSNQNIMLPGIGSYINIAITHANLPAIFYAILAMFIVILIYDQLLFRPLLSWAARFEAKDIDDTEVNRAWFYELLIKTRLLKIITNFADFIIDFFLNSRYCRLPKKEFIAISPLTSRLAVLCWNTILVVGTLCSILYLWRFIAGIITLSEIQHVFYLGAITALKVTVLIILASIIWVPIGVWIGLHPNARQIIQPITQFMAAFPVNLIYPLAVTGILYFHLNIEIWSTPLMILGTQWYILFNVIAGASTIPKDLQYVTQNFKVKHWLWWKRLALPSIFPYYVTGAMTAAGGCWNASIVADVLQWGNHKLIATGLGSYISQYTTIGDFPRIALGIGVMCFYVLVINRLIWRKLYNFAASRFVLE